MVSHLDQPLGQLIRVDVQQPLGQVVGDAHVRLTDVFVGVHQDFVRVFVVAKLLFLSCDVHCDFHSLAHVANGAV